MGYIHLPLFIISFSIGVLLVYLHAPNKQIIVVYPNNDRLDKIQYKDKANTCYNINANKTNCKDKNGIDIYKKFKMQS